jgi:hypothetical protein
MNTIQEKDNRAWEQAKAQLDSIREMVADYQEAVDNENDEAIEQAEETIQNDPLSVEVRTDWHVPGDEKGNKPTEYMILLCTGGPAVRIVGDLNEYCEPESAKIEYQDWFTSWETYHLTGEEEEDVISYARCFYFGE